MDHEELFSCSIPVPFHASKKNGRPVFNGRLVSNPRTVQAKKFLLPCLLKSRMDHGIYEPIDYDLRSVLVFVYSHRDYWTTDPKTKLLRRKHTVADTSNLVEFIHDSLQDTGIIANDQQICELHVKRIVGERTEVRIQLFKMQAEALQLTL